MSKLLAIIAVTGCLFVQTEDVHARKKKDPKPKLAARKGLDWLAKVQNKQGYWEATNNQYRVAMTALAGTAMICEGSTTTHGRYSKNIRLAVDYLMQLSQKNGLIGYPHDYHYTYGHGFSMLFLSQVYGEEEDSEQRRQLKQVLQNAVAFSVNAQTDKGGWGYVSAKDGSNFDEGSTCITQVQGLRGCRNAGIPVPKAVLANARDYIKKCTNAEGGVMYSIRGGGSRPPITAAALAAMFNAGEYDTEHTKKMLKYCEKAVWPGGGGAGHFGHWHYTHLYYSQVMYRQGDKTWDKYFAQISTEIMRKQGAGGSWVEGHVGPVYTTAINCTILLLDNGYLPIYER